MGVVGYRGSSQQFVVQILSVFIRMTCRSLIFLALVAVGQAAIAPAAEYVITRKRRAKEDAAAAAPKPEVKVQQPSKAEEKETEDLVAKILERRRRAGRPVQESPGKLKSIRNYLI